MSKVGGLKDGKLDRILRRVDRLQDAGMYSEAIDTIDRGLRYSGGNNELLVRKVHFLNAQCRWGEAVETLRQVSSAQVSYPGMLLGLSRALRGLGEDEEVERILKEGVRDFPENWELTVALERLKKNQSDFEGMLVLSKQLTRIKPEHSLGWLDGGEALLELGRLEEANARVQKILETLRDKRGNAPAVWRTVGLLRRLDRESEADELFDNWVSRHPALKDNNEVPSAGFSQLGQDLWVLDITDYKRGGYFVEFGACDGIFLSNTYLLERRYDWQGICVEPNQKQFKYLKRNRNCVTSDECVYSQSGLNLPFMHADAFGGIDEFVRDDSEYTGELKSVSTISLNDLLESENAPPSIDYISVDTEGSEYEILKVFDFKRWRVRFWTIEHNYSQDREKIYDLMSLHGYRRIRKRFDDWYYLENDKVFLNAKVDGGDFEGRFRTILADPNNNLIPRVADAGAVKDGILTMHNGLRLRMHDNAYYGKFVETLSHNHGVHEPQEERVFQEVLKHLGSGAVMIELGAYWGFYSMWFHQAIPQAKNYLVEPDPERLEVGRSNFELNGMKGQFFNCIVGKDDLRMDDFIDEQGIEFVHLLHVDIQGAEFEMLKGCKKMLEQQRIGYIFISTHSQFLHKICRRILRKSGYTIIASADFENETFCHDGILVARLESMDGVERLKIGSRLKGPGKDERALIKSSIRPDRNLLDDVFERIPASSFRVVVDVGANRGQSAIPFLKDFPEAEIHAFEPDPKEFEILRSRVAEEERVKLYRMALGAKSGCGQLRNFSSSQVNSILKIDPRSGESVASKRTVPKGKVEVEIGTLGSIWPSFKGKRVDFLKIDTQGYDLEVLLGAYEWIRPQYVSYIKVEVMFAPVYRDQCTFQQLHSFLDGAGFRFEGLYDLVRRPSDQQLLWGDALYSGDPPPG